MTNLAATCLLAAVRRCKRGGIIVGEHTLTPEQTERHVRTLRRWFDFVGLDELPRRIARPGRKPFCLLTFDDGKRSNFTESAPVLERLGVPAVFYVTTGFVDDGSPLWFDVRHQLVQATGCCPKGLELDTLKQLPMNEISARLARACREHSFVFASDSDHVRPMSWAEVRNLDERGFVIGAHGATHAILTRENKGKSYSEIETSLARVSAELGRPCGTFAFPNGNYNDDLIGHARRCGAGTLMTTDPMWADGSSALSRLPRIQLFGNSGRGHIEMKIALAAFRGVLRNPDGTGRQYRSRHGSRGLPARQLLPN